MTDTLDPNSRLMPRSLIEEKPDRSESSAPLPPSRFEVLSLSTLGEQSRRTQASGDKNSQTDAPETVTGENYLKSYKKSKLKAHGLLVEANEQGTDYVKRYQNESRRKHEQFLADEAKKEADRKEYDQQQDQAKEIEINEKAATYRSEAQKIEAEMAWWEQQSGAGVHSNETVSANLDELKRQLDQIPLEYQR